MNKINWDDPTEQDEARFAAAALAGIPIQRCLGEFWSKGGNLVRCEGIGRWLLRGVKYTPGSSEYREVLLPYCTKHAAGNWKVVDAVTGTAYSYPKQEAMRRIVRETPDWR